MNRLIFSLAAFAGVATALPALALPAVAQAQPVAQRQAKQQRRIDQGVATGALTRHETRRLERGEARLAYRKDMMRADHGGRLTRFDRVALNHQQDRLSGRIYRAKHNGRVD